MLLGCAVVCSGRTASHNSSRICQVDAAMGHLLAGPIKPHRFLLRL
jgi:hypothetical protein